MTSWHCPYTLLGCVRVTVALVIDNVRAFTKRMNIIEFDCGILTTCFVVALLDKLDTIDIWSGAIIGTHTHTRLVCHHHHPHCRTTYFIHRTYFFFVLSLSHIHWLSSWESTLYEEKIDSIPRRFFFPFPIIRQKSRRFRTFGVSTTVMKRGK